MKLAKRRVFYVFTGFGKTGGKAPIAFKGGAAPFDEKNLSRFFHNGGYHRQRVVVKITRTARAEIPDNIAFFFFCRWGRRSKDRIFYVFS